MECIREGCTSDFMARTIEHDMLEASLQETDEDHLGVTLIRSGDSVTIIMRLDPCVTVEKAVCAWRE